jgi:hypothetical protein
MPEALRRTCERTRRTPPKEEQMTTQLHNQCPTGLRRPDVNQGFVAISKDLSQRVVSFAYRDRLG